MKIISAMGKTKLVLTIAVFLVTLFKTGYCLDCFFCDPLSQGTDCNDYYNKDSNADMVDTCGRGRTHCLKIKTVSYVRDSGYITGNVREGLTTSRLCVQADRDECQYLKAGNSKIIYCTCSSDFCNSGVVLLPSLSVFLIMVLTVVFFK